MELELNLLDWNLYELENKLELEDMKHTYAHKDWNVIIVTNFSNLRIFFPWPK